MKALIKIICISVVLASATSAIGQQEPHFTQYSDNTLFVNPAYAGSRGVLNLTGIHRQQWTGFEGRPISTTFSAHSPLSYESVGVGVTMVNDQSGPIKQTMIYGDFSYTLKFKNGDRKLSFGMKAGMNLISITSANLNTDVDNDPKLLQNVKVVAKLKKKNIKTQIEKVVIVQQ